MTIIEEHTFRSTTLREAPVRATRAEAEADEARGVELEAFLAVLPTLTAEQWDAAGAAAGEFLAPTVSTLQDSAIELMARLIDPTSPDSESDQ